MAWTVHQESSMAACCCSGIIMQPVRHHKQYDKRYKQQGQGIFLHWSMWKTDLHWTKISLLSFLCSLPLLHFPTHCYWECPLSCFSHKHLFWNDFYRLRHIKTWCKAHPCMQIKHTVIYKLEANTKNKGCRKLLFHSSQTTITVCLMPSLKKCNITCHTRQKASLG